MRHRPEPGISTSAPVLKAIAKVTVQCDFDELFPLVVPLLGLGLAVCGAAISWWPVASRPWVKRYC